MDALKLTTDFDTSSTLVARGSECLAYLELMDAVHEAEGEARRADEAFLRARAIRSISASIADRALGRA